MLGALAIATALFSIPDETSVNEIGLVAIAAICMPVPLAIVGTFLLDWGFVAFLTIRKWREALRYWWFVLSNLRKVGKTDAVRDLWLEQRDEDWSDSNDE